MITYVVGFAFSEDKKQVVMIQKEHPSWQKGKLNGIGGKADQWVEETATTRRHIETPYQAMVREFEEETGARFEAWENYAVCRDVKKDITMYCYRTFTERIAECKSMTEEKLKICHPPSVIMLGPPDTLSNIPFLLAMAMDRNIHDAQILATLDHA